MRRNIALIVFWLAVPCLAWSEVSVTKPDGINMPPAQIAVSPSRIELEIGKKSANSSVKLFNLGDKSVTVHTSVQHWDLDEANTIRVIEPTPQSLDQWMVINPVDFTIPAGKSQTVRLSVRPYVEPEQGEHRGIIYFDQQLPDDAPSAGVSVTFRLGIVVYGLAGQIVRDGKLEAIRFDQQQQNGLLAFDVRSTGNAGIRLDGQYSIWHRADFPGADAVPDYNLKDKDEEREIVLQTGSLPVLPVLASTRRTLTNAINLPDQAGDYILFVRGKLGDQSFSREFAFSRG